MPLRDLEALIDFSARTLFIVLSKKFGIDKAYQEAYSKASRAEKKLPPPLLYNTARKVVDKYYTLRYIEQKAFGAKTSLKRLVKLWLYYYAETPPKLPAKYENDLRRLKKRIEREAKIPQSIEEALENIEDPYERLAVKYSYPLWFVKHMKKLLGEKRIEVFLKALNKEHWWIRVNTLKTDPEAVREKLEAKGVRLVRDNDLEYMFKVIGFEEPLHHLEEMWKGEIVFQDKASAMVVEALEPREGDTILDLAAAPGIKASLIMMLTHNNARIIAVDLSWERIKRMRKLLKLYGADLTKIELVNGDAATLELMPSKPIKILLDAPCTSSGAIGKDPAIKIHLGEESWTRRFPYFQRLMLENIKKLILSSRVDRAVYATCSVLDTEGEENIELVGLEDYLEKPKLPSALPGYDKYRFYRSVARFFPDTHETQGFFIACLSS